MLPLDWRDIAKDVLLLDFNAFDAAKERLSGLGWQNQTAHLGVEA